MKNSFKFEMLGYALGAFTFAIMVWFAYGVGANLPSNNDVVVTDTKLVGDLLAGRSVPFASLSNVHSRIRIGEDNARAIAKQLGISEQEVVNAVNENNLLVIARRPATNPSTAPITVER